MALVGERILRVMHKAFGVSYMRTILPRLHGGSGDGCARLFHKCGDKKGQH